MRTVQAGLLVGLAWVATSAGAPFQSAVRTVPAGTILQVLLQTPLNSGTTKLDDRFTATSLQAYEAQGQVVLPAGLVARGFVSSVRPSTKTERQGQMTLSFEELLLGEPSLKLRASVAGVLDMKRSEPLDRTGVGGSAVGELPDRAGVPMVGVVIGAGGTLMSSTGADVILPVGAVLRIRLDRPLDVPITR